MEMLNPHCGVDRNDRGVVRLSICNAGTLNILSSAVTDGSRMCTNSVTLSLRSTPDSLGMRSARLYLHG